LSGVVLRCHQRAFAQFYSRNAYLLQRAEACLKTAKQCGRKRAVNEAETGAIMGPAHAA
jgi:hypothetical protein